MTVTEKDELRPGWHWVRLKDLCSVDKKLVQPGSEVAESLPYIGLEHIESESGRILKTPTSEPEDSGNSTTHRFDDRHVLYGKLRPYLNKVAEPDFSGRCTTELIPLLPFAKTDRNFLAFALRRQEIVDAAMRGNTGSRMPRANVTELLEERIPAPPFPEQQRIADIIKTKLAVVERACKAGLARLDAARSLPAAYLREVYENGEAKQWQWSELAEVATLLPSKSIATAGDTEVTAITTACLTERGFDPSGVKTATMHRPDAEIATVGVGEVLIARSNTPELVGRVSVFCGVPLGAVASDLTIRVWPGERIDSDFLGYYLSYLFLTGYWRDNAGGASGTMKKITRTQLAGISVPVPDRDTQARVRRRLKSRLAMVDRLATELDLECSGIKALGPALLRQAFCGAL